MVYYVLQNKVNKKLVTGYNYSCHRCKYSEYDPPVMWSEKYVENVLNGNFEKIRLGPTFVNLNKLQFVKVTLNIEEN